MITSAKKWLPDMFSSRLPVCALDYSHVVNEFWWNLTRDVVHSGI